MMLKRDPSDGVEIVVVSNREPCVHDFSGSGEIVARRPASGVVSALEPVVQRYGGRWIAHGSGSADRVVTDASGRITITSSNGSYVLRRVWLTRSEERGYYYGFANQGLWPLCHRAFAAPLFRRSDWAAYQAVNARFARAIASEVKSPRPVVFVQDYHFALLPQFLRERCPEAVIVMFWHIPWPTPEQFSLCPYAKEILTGLLGSDIVGFQTNEHCDRFVRTIGNSPTWTVDQRSDVVHHGQRRTDVRAYPISVEWPNRWTCDLPPVEECRHSIRSRYGINETASLVVSVDRLDYTKGFDERLVAIERLFEISASAGRNVAFLQIAAPTRSAIARYADLAVRVRNHIARLNRRFGTTSFLPITYLEQYTEPLDVFRCYRAADVCYVGSLDDGMNLVAKEFVSARDDEHGVLVLSQFAGAACELTDALLVNPYDVDGVAEMLFRAAHMPLIQQQVRLREMRRQIATRHVLTWASEMLNDAIGVYEASPNWSGDVLHPAATDVATLDATA